MRISATALGLFALLVTSTAASALDMETGRRTTQPLGHWQLCKSLPEECRAKTRGKRSIKLTDELMAVLQSVNDDVNHAVAPMTDWVQHGVEEHWAYPGAVGDCEDYVLEKRRRLMEYGFRPGELLITVVIQPNGEGHAVLSVRTSQGEFVLDNIDPKVRHWTRTNYDYLKRQSVRHTGTWVSIRDNRARLAMR